MNPLTQALTELKEKLKESQALANQALSKVEELTLDEDLIRNKKQI